MILVDTNVLVAAARTADTHHVAAARLLRETDERFLVAPTVLAETCYLLHEFGGPAPEVAFLRSIAAGELELAVLTVADTARMAELTEHYADLGLGGTDAVAGGPSRTPGPDHPGDLRPPALHRRATRTYPQLHPAAHLTPRQHPREVSTRRSELAQSTAGKQHATHGSTRRLPRTFGACAAAAPTPGALPSKNAATLFTETASATARPEACCGTAQVSDTHPPSPGQEGPSQTLGVLNPA